jgi:hypothetical protein
MRKAITTTLLLASLSFMAGSAGTGGRAMGSLSSARFSDDNTQYIGCAIRVTSGTSPAQAVCFARDEQGDYLSCSSTDYDHRQAMYGISDYSWINFSVAADGRTCSWIEVNTKSTHIP